MVKKLTAEEVKARDLRIAELKAEFKAAEAKREKDGVKETKEETKVREADEERRLKEVSSEVSEEDQLHLDARNSRVAQVKANIETARLARVELEKTGVTETEGAKLDREAKEAKELEVANKLYVTEPIDLLAIEFGNGDLNVLRDKINEILKSYCQGK